MTLSNLPPLRSPEAILDRPTALAALVTCAVIAAQWLTVTFNYGGNWTALFCTGASQALPHELEAGTYRFPASHGYDGQMYRLVAHDPWLQAGYVNYVDDPALRYRRILVPAAAWLIRRTGALGADEAYIALVWACVFAGVYWLAKFFRLHGLDARWAACFPLLPASLISLDRMTVDIALITFIAALLARWDRAGVPEKIAWLGACALVRDLGFFVIAAAMLFSAFNRRWRGAFLFGCAAIPAISWYAWIRTGLSNAGGTAALSPALPGWLFRRFPGWGAISAILSPPAYPLPAPLKIATQTLDAAALAGILVAFVLSFASFRRRIKHFDSWLLLCFTLVFVAADNERLYRDLFSHPRAFTPMLALAAFHAALRKQWLGVVPLAAVSFRVVWQMGGQALGILDRLVW